jgi:type III restriction enzyme
MLFEKTLKDVDDPKKSNIMYRENDRLSGRKPIEYVQATNPIVIIDEPQSVDNTPKSKQAIAMLNPMCTLRYSATHRNEYNLVYKLDPIKAFELKMVKQIAVASVLDEDSFNDAYVKLLAVDNKNGISAKLEFHENTNDGPKPKKKKVTQGSDLFTLSNEREAYRDNYIVDEISWEPGNEFVRFTGGLRLELGESRGGLTDEIRKIQIKNTIQEHLEKERQLKDKGIKVLSLFFIDRVEKYRQYDDENNPQKGVYALWFEEIFQEMIQRPEYAELNMPTVDKVHDGYFAVDNQGRAKNTRGESQADQTAYDLIMKDKEELLLLTNPLRFIFSHSALREGWDNPNVFQICTLNETGSEMKKRQEIGRGLRIPVNQEGERVFDTSINKLVIIANEHYEEFAAKLQTEYEEDCGVRFGHVPKHAFAKIEWVDEYDNVRAVSREESMAIFSDLWEKDYIDDSGKILPKFNPLAEGFELDIADRFQPIKHEVVNVVQSYQFNRQISNHNDKKTLMLNKQVYLDEEFKKLWHKINKKTRYSVEFSTDDLVAQIVGEIKRMETIEPAKISVRKGVVDITKGGVVTTEVRNQVNLSETKHSLPDILAYLQRETELTRQTLFRILADSDRLHEFIVNPQKYMDQVVKIIRRVLHKLMINGIKYEQVAGEEYEMRLFEEEEIVEYMNNLVEVNKSVYNAVVYDSEVERRFAQELDQREDIKLFVKLPKWFRVDTPIGEYNPDWAVLKQNGEALYLVRETKGVKDFAKLRTSEAEKIQCGKKHFDELGVDFKTVVTASEV